MAKSFFITGTDTDVGKTYVAKQLLQGFCNRQMRVSGFKPVAAGAKEIDGELKNQDAIELIANSSTKLQYAEVNPYCFEPAIAPHIAAKRKGLVMDMSLVEEAYVKHVELADVVIIEGAGGWKVPFNHHEGFDDVALSLATPIVLVVGLRLGCINHALLTEEAILNKGCRLVGWIGNSLEQCFVEKDENIDALKETMKSPCIGLFDYHPNQGENHIAPQRNIESVLDYLLDFR